jgi:glycerophosphoryl diester phosphodiesterase
MHQLLDRPSPFVVGHRGGAGLAPENTMAAFECGRTAGAHGFELDVRLTRDGVVAVIHDATVDRTTDATGAVDAFAFDDLRRLDAGARCVDAAGESWAGRGVTIPALHEVLDRFPNVPFIVEVKGGDERAGLAALEVVRRAGALARVCFGGFSRTVLDAIRRGEPDAVTSAARIEGRVALYQSWIGWPLTRKAFRAFQVPEVAQGHRVVTPRFIRAAHRGRLPVHVWTVNRAEDMRRLLGWGADALITDRPDLARPVVDGHIAELAQRQW